MSNVQVAVRARPLTKREVDLGTKVMVKMRNKSTVVTKTVLGLSVGETRDDTKEFLYDYSYWSVDTMDDNFVTQEQVYTDLGKSVLESAFQGYNACIFAYGQTGSGKTHTMMGSEENPGLIPRICESLYAHIANGSKRNVSYRVQASYMEIYNEKVRDLLVASSTPSKGQHNLKIREHPKEGPYVEHLTRQTVGDLNAILQLMRLGNGRRVTASTKMNDMSSRSHAMFTLVFTQAAYSSDLPCETVSKIHLVDLAGSERVSATGAEGLRLKEGGNINRSLACLGNVISALADMSIQCRKNKEGGRRVFVPYRDSVLTWLLKDSLGGNSKTIMVATISPADVNYGETLSTLRYASRAKNIVNKPVVNEDANVRLIRELKSEIKRLKGIITAAKLDDTDLLLGETDLELNIHKKEEMIAELTKSWAGKWDQDLQRMVEERNLALHSEGIKMTLASERPHLLAVDNDIYGGGIIIYQLKNGRTTMGTSDSSPEPDIVLIGSEIQPQHCAIECWEDKVTLVLEQGVCFINHAETLEDVNLSHGDLLQLGATTVFRFNHPEEARTLKQMACALKNPLLTLSPISSSSQLADTSLDKSHVEDELEEQREALERDYNQKMENLREELETRNREDKAKLTQELEELRHRVVFSHGDRDDGNRTDGGGDDLCRNSAYELMQSIACTTADEKPDISDRVVVGQERDLTCSPHRIQSSSSEESSISSSSQPSSPSSSSGTSPENRFRRMCITTDPLDCDTLDISFVEQVQDGENDVAMGFTLLMKEESVEETSSSERTSTPSPLPLASEPSETGAREETMSSDLIGSREMAESNNLIGAREMVRSSDLVGAREVRSSDLIGAREMVRSSDLIGAREVVRSSDLIGAREMVRSSDLIGAREVVRSSDLIGAREVVRSSDLIGAREVVRSSDLIGAREVVRSSHLIGAREVVRSCDLVSAQEVADSSELWLELTRERLRKKEAKFEEIERQKREVECKLSEAEMKSRSLRCHLSDQQIRHMSEQRELMAKVDDLEKELYLKELGTQHRARTNALDSVNAPRNRRHRPRSHSINRYRHSSSSLMVEVPNSLLRGEGWGSYHVFEVRIHSFGEKWSLYKSYPHFKIFHDEITKRYSQLTILSLPPSKWFGVKNKSFVEQRRVDLQTYMQSLMAICITLPTCPLYDITSRRTSRDKLITFSSFFDSGKRTGL